jgi:hypothetical protein
MQITYMEWYMGVFQSRLSEIISSKQMKECHSSGVVEQLTESQCVLFLPLPGQLLLQVWAAATQYVLTKVNGYVANMEMFICEITILFISQRLQCYHRLGNHWPFSGYTLIFSTDIQSDQKVMQPNVDIVLYGSKNKSYDRKSCSFVRFHQFMHDVYNKNEA